MGRFLVLGLFFLSLIWTTASSAKTPNMVQIDFLCAHRQSVEYLMDLMEAEGGFNAALLSSKSAVAVGECVRFPEMKLPVQAWTSERPAFDYRPKPKAGEPPQFNNDEIVLRAVKVKNLWGISIQINHKA